MRLPWARVGMDDGSGQTGAGKTYTMHGPNMEAADCHTNEQRGLLPRVLEYLFAQIAREQRKVRGATPRRRAGRRRPLSSPRGVRGESEGKWRSLHRTTASSTSAAVPTSKSTTKSSLTCWTSGARSAVRRPPYHRRRRWTLSRGRDGGALLLCLGAGPRHSRGQPPRGRVPRERHRGGADVDCGRLRGMQSGAAMLRPGVPCLADLSRWRPASRRPVVVITALAPGRPQSARGRDVDEPREQPQPHGVHALHRVHGPFLVPVLDTGAARSPAASAHARIRGLRLLRRAAEVP